MVSPDDPFKRVYDSIGDRKSKPEDLQPYSGGNGRIDRAVAMIRAGALGSLEKLAADGSAILDIGGATGNLGYALRDVFETRWVVDIYEGAKDAAIRKGNRFITTNVDRDGLPIADSSIDLVTALDVIEHVIDPQMLAAECFRVLRSGGRVLVNTPNIQFWKHLESLVIHGVFPHTSGDTEVYHGGHVAFYNLHDMQRIFVEEAGFVDGRMHTDGLTFSPPPPLWLSVSRVPAMQMAVPDLIFSCRKP